MRKTTPSQCPACRAPVLPGAGFVVDGLAQELGNYCTEAHAKRQLLEGCLAEAICQGLETPKNKLPIEIACPGIYALLQQAFAQGAGLSLDTALCIGLAEKVLLQCGWHLSEVTSPEAKTSLFQGTLIRGPATYFQALRTGARRTVVVTLAETPVRVNLVLLCPAHLAGNGVLLEEVGSGGLPVGIVVGEVPVQAAFFLLQEEQIKIEAALAIPPHGTADQREVPSCSSLGPSPAGRQSVPVLVRPSILVEFLHLPNQIFSSALRGVVLGRQ
jgi:hypothetical protein